MGTRGTMTKLTGWTAVVVTCLAPTFAEENTGAGATDLGAGLRTITLVGGASTPDDGARLPDTDPIDPDKVLVPPLPGEGKEGDWVEIDTIPEAEKGEGETLETLPPPSGTYQPYAPHLGGPHTGAIPYAPPVLHDHCVETCEDPFFWHMVERVAHVIEKPLHPMGDFFGDLMCKEHMESELHLNHSPIGITRVRPRTPLVFEWGECFLKPGRLRQGCYTETCEVIRPAIWVWGEYRSQLIAWRENQPGRASEWANRLDLFGQVNFSGTERIVLGLRPLDEQDQGGQARGFTGYDFHDGAWNDGTNMDVQTLFFEGDIGEIFPLISPYDFVPTDIGFSIGRQPLLAQQGLLINEDRLDMVTLTRNTLNGDGNLNLRATAFYAFNEVNRDSTNPAIQGNFRDNQAAMFGLLTESDFEWATVNLDAVYLSADDPSGSMWAYGLAIIRRINLCHQTFNNSFHILVSDPVGRETIHSGQGELIFNQFSWTPHETEDVIYVNTFWGIDQFTSPARGPLMGGPVGQVGILWAHSGVGRWGPPISNRLNDTVGATLGYQMFYDEWRRNVTVEIGARSDTGGASKQTIGAGVRYQRAMGQHWIWTLDTFVTQQEAEAPASGGRTEILYRF